MPEPVIVHVIGTVTLLSAALLVIASVALVQQAYSVRTLNAMLSEAAESCAKQIVELVSIHTLGGEDHTYMSLTLPKSLGGEPYNVTLVNMGENMIMVIAQLQLHRQVRIVVTPNFGQAPVHAVPTATRFGDLLLLPTILLPTPQGWEAALVAVRNESAILVGFTNQPPLRAKGEKPPSCSFLDWTKRIRARSGSRVLLNFTIYNPGDKPVYAAVELVDHSSKRLDAAILYVEDDWVAFGSIPVHLNIPGGTYLWNLICATGYSEPATVGIVLEIVAPKIEVVDVTSALVGEPGSTKLLNLTLRNTGSIEGTVRISLSYALGDKILVDNLKLAPDQTRSLSLQIQLPSTPGRYDATLKVFTIETEEEISIPVSIRAGVYDPYISWVNSTIVGLPSWQPKLYVEIRNPANTEADIQVALNGVRLESIKVPAQGTHTVVLRPRLPEQRGKYTWLVELIKDDEIVSSAKVEVEVRDFKALKQEPLYLDTRLIVIEDKNRNTGQRRIVTTRPLDVDLHGHINFGIWVALKVYLPSLSGINGGIALNSTDKLYEVSAYNSKLRGRVHTQLYLRSYDSTTKQWGSPTLSPPVPLPNEGYYPLHAFARCDGSACSLRTHLYIPPATELNLEHTFSGGVPHILALLVDEYEGRFLEIVVRKEDTRYVTVVGLPDGWHAEILSGGQLIARSSDGKLYVPANYIIYNAVLRLIDPYGEYSRTWDFDRVVGGDIIEFSSD